MRIKSMRWCWHFEQAGRAMSPAFGSTVEFHFLADRLRLEGITTAGKTTLDDRMNILIVVEDEALISMWV